MADGGLTADAFQNPDSRQPRTMAERARRMAEYARHVERGEPIGYIPRGETRDAE